MTKHLGGIIGYKDKTSSRHLIGFPDGSNLYFYFTCAAALSDGRFTPPNVGWKYDSVVCPKAAGTMALGRCNRCFIWRVNSVGRRYCYFVDLLAQIHIHAINRFGTSTTCSIKRHAVSKLLAPVVPPHCRRDTGGPLEVHLVVGIGARLTVFSSVVVIVCCMDATAKFGRNSVTKHHIQPECGE